MSAKADAAIVVAKIAAAKRRIEEEFEYIKPPDKRSRQAPAQLDSIETNKLDLTCLVPRWERSDVSIS